MKALFFAVLVNVALKIWLHGDHAQVGLAFATSIGGWVNLVLLIWFARRAGLFAFDEDVARSAIRLALAGLVLALVLWFADSPVRALVAGKALHNELALALLALIGAVVYGAMVMALFGRRWLLRFGAGKRPPARTPPPTDASV